MKEGGNKKYLIMSHNWFNFPKDICYFRVGFLFSYSISILKENKNFLKGGEK